VALGDVARVVDPGEDVEVAQPRDHHPARPVVRGTDAAATSSEVALHDSASRVVVGMRRSRLGNFMRGSIASRLRRRAPDLQIDEVSA
jgi:nucleotide-binding universal stress UspA family protein